MAPGQAPALTKKKEAGPPTSRRKQVGYLAMSIGLAPAVVHLRTKRMIVVISEQCAIDAGNAATWHECVERRTKTLIRGNKRTPFCKTHKRIRRTAKLYTR
ncbi:hypothetical protein MRX96_025860 [Rhipicephalus microplus]